MVAETKAHSLWRSGAVRPTNRWATSQSDAVATVLTTFSNARGVDRKTAAQIVRIDRPVWTRAVAMVKAGHRNKDVLPIFFCGDRVHQWRRKARACGGGWHDCRSRRHCRPSFGHRRRVLARSGRSLVSMTDALFTVRKTPPRPNPSPLGLGRSPGRQATDVSKIFARTARKRWRARCARCVRSVAKRT